MKRENRTIKKLLTAILLSAICTLMIVASVSAECAHEFGYSNKRSEISHDWTCKKCGYYEVQNSESCKFNKKTYTSFNENNHYYKAECVCGNKKSGPEEHKIVNGKCACGFTAKLPGKFKFTKATASKAKKTSVTIPGQWKDHKWYPAHKETRYSTKLTLKWKKSANATAYCITVFEGNESKALPGNNVARWKKTSYSGKINLKKKGKIKVVITPFNGAIDGKAITKTIKVK